MGDKAGSIGRYLVCLLNVSAPFSLEPTVHPSRFYTPDLNG